MGNDELLDGTNPDADTRLMLAVQEAMLPDPFDGVPADVTADEAHGGKGGTMGDAAAAMTVPGNGDYITQAYRIGRERGVVDVIEWLRANEYPAAAQAVALNMERIQADIRRKADKDD